MKSFWVLLGCLLLADGLAAEESGILESIKHSLGFDEPATEAPPSLVEQLANLTVSFLTPEASEDSAQTSSNETETEKPVSSAPEQKDTGFISSLFGSATDTSTTVKETQSIDDPFKSEICKSCECIDTDPFFVNCAYTDIQELFLQSAWPKNSTLTRMDANFDNNRLTTIIQFSDLPLIDLSFCNNLIRAVEPAAFRNLQQLEYLDLSRNLLTHESLTRDVFKGQFSESDYEPLNLKTLKLGYNQIHSLDHDAFDHLPNLEILELNDNPLQVIDHQTAVALTSLRKLKKLNLAQTGLSDVPDGVFHAIRGISVLILSGNQFSRVPAEVQRAVNLQYLNLNNNPIETLNSESFTGLDKLKQLNISAMGNLKSIGAQTFTPLTALESLWCSFNEQLTKIHPRAFQDIAKEKESLNLREVHVRGNAIPTLPQNLLPWDQLDVIDIEENPYTCSGRSNEWIKAKLIPIIDDKTPDLTLSILCDSPDNSKGTSLANVDFTGDYTPTLQDSDENTDYPMPRSSAFSTAVMIIALVAAVAIIAGVVVMGFIAVKRRGIQQVYQAPGQFVRYVRAQSDEFGDKRLQDDERAILPQDQMYHDEP